MIVLEIPEEYLEGSDAEPEYQIAHLLLEGVLFTNNGYWLKDWPKDKTTLHVNCNDVFNWGCADSEDILYSEIPELYAMWKKDPVWGSSAWCIKKRKLLPQPPVEREMRKQGVYTDLLESL